MASSKRSAGPTVARKNSSERDDLGRRLPAYRTLALSLTPGVSRGRVTIPWPLKHPDPEVPPAPHYLKAHVLRNPVRTYSRVRSHRARSTDRNRVMRSSCIPRCTRAREGRRALQRRPLPSTRPSFLARPACGVRRCQSVGVRYDVSRPVRQGDGLGGGGKRLIERGDK